jgi:Putative prokaryotic signal transducing protein
MRAREKPSAEKPSAAVGGEQPLVCPGCAREHPPSERFCVACGMPLVHSSNDAEQPVSERQRKVRKIKPQYSEGKLVKIAGAQNGAEAEMIQGMLLEEGIPSMARRSPGADVPDFLIAGRRDILVPESGAEAAREALKWDEKL